MPSAIDAVRVAVNPPSVLGKLALLMLGVGVIALTAGDWGFQQVFRLAPAAAQNAGPSLVLCACSLTAFGVTVVRLLRHSDPLNLGISGEWNPILGTAVSIAIGYLIGTTIFV